jgi:serine O-acetyltransferase
MSTAILETPPTETRPAETLRVEAPPENSPHPLQWEVASIVAELRQLRNSSLAQRQRLDRPVKLPLRSNLTAVMAGLSAVLFPNRLGDRALAQGSIDFYVGHTLDTTLCELCEQVLRELLYANNMSDTTPELLHRATRLVQAFAQQLPRIRQLLEADMLAAFQTDPTAVSQDEILACSSGFIAILHYRIAHELYHLGTPLVARILAEIAHASTGCEIHPAAQIGTSFSIAHGTGIVIGQTAVIGDRVALWQGVTLAALGSMFADGPESSVGTSANGSPANSTAQPSGSTALHPVIEDDVVIYAGATLIGPIRIGRGSVIGGNVWLTQDVPPHSNIRQAKFQHEYFGDGAGI